MNTQRLPTAVLSLFIYDFPYQPSPNQLSSNQPEELDLPRLPEFDETHFDARQRTIYDEILTSRGHLGGPFKIWLYSPELADRTQRLGEFLRYHTSLDPRLSELAILVVGRHYNCQVEWTLHERFAREAKLDSAIIDALRQRAIPDKLQADEAAVYSYASEILTGAVVSEETFATAQNILGDKALVELTSLVGHYVHVSMTLNAFQVPLPLDVPPTLPDAPVY